MLWISFILYLNHGHFKKIFENTTNFLDFQKPKTLDINGTISLDSKKNMQLSWFKVQQEFNLQHIKFEDYFKNIGRPFFDILNKEGLYDEKSSNPD